MRYEEDAFGQALKDYLQGNEVFEIIERDDGYIDATKSVGDYLAEFEEWPEIQQDAMGYVEGYVLDIGCGPGKHSLYLKEEGYEVLGIDVSQIVLEICKERGLDNVKNMSISEIDEDTDTFDTILMLGNNFGLLESPEKAKDYLERFYQATSDDARVIAESRDVHDTDNEFHKQYQENNIEEGKFPGELRIRNRYKGYCTPWYNYLMVSKEEMEDILEETDWYVDKFLDEDSPQYIAIIKKES